MRQVFSSHRIENVEGVARLLEDDGIQVRITNGRGWKGAIRGNFSYRDSDIASTAPKPAVWVVNSGDSPRARELLREAGLLLDERSPLDSYLPQSVHDRDEGAAQRRRRRRPAVLKLAVLVLVGVAVGLGVRGMRDTPAQATSPTATATASTTTLAVTDTVPVVSADGVHTIPTPPALAAALVAQALDEGGNACLSIDGEDPPAATLDALREAGVAARPLSACTDGAAVRFMVADYRTDGSGQGTVRVEVQRPGAAPEVSGFIVERSGFDWRVEESAQ